MTRNKILHGACTDQSEYVQNNMFIKSQLFPISLTIATFFVLSFLLFACIHSFNLLPIHGKVFLQLRPVDILVGLTIYIKTAIDFALFIGSLMHRHPGVKNRIAIELGTSLGNGIGTLLIVTVWIFFKEVPILLITMIALASLVLLRMAEDGLKEYQISNTTNVKYPIIHTIIYFLANLLRIVNNIFDPMLGKLLPRYERKEKPHITFWSLFLFAFTIPFLLGLDDFAGYIPLFSLINVFGFAVGVLLGHMFLTASLFAFPQKTTQFVSRPIILVAGSFVFLGLSLWGFVEVAQGLLRILK